jgi:two-component system probable response regulator PhcQ
MTSGYDYKEFAVLFVDDEEQARKYFKLAFENDFQVLTAPSVDAAWAIVAAASPRVGVLVTDQRMPEKTGTDLLGRVRRTHPEIVRILATAYADLEAAIDAVNSGAIFKYLVKPWEVRELRITLRHAMEYFMLRRERDLLLKAKLSSLEHLLVADRVRSFAILAEGLSAQVRNTMTALQAYVELAAEQSGSNAPRPAVSVEQRLRNLQWETEDAGRHLLKVVQGIAAATIEPRHAYDDQAELGVLLETAWVQARTLAEAPRARLDVEVAPDLPKLLCSRGMLERLFTTLFRTLLRPDTEEEALPDARVRVVARERTQLWGADSISIELVRDGFDTQRLSPLFMPAWVRGAEGDAPDLLSAFFIAHHHGGTIGLHRTDAVASGFRVTLPFAPDQIRRPALDEDATAKIFDTLPRWEALERGA